MVFFENNPWVISYRSFIVSPSKTVETIRKNYFHLYKCHLLGTESIPTGFIQKITSSDAKINSLWKMNKKGFLEKHPWVIS